MAAESEQEYNGLRETDPYDGLDNGRVVLEIEVCDPVTKMGISTSLLNFESEGSICTEKLARHLWERHSVDVEDYGLEIVD